MSMSLLKRLSRRGISIITSVMLLPLYITPVASYNSSETWNVLTADPEIAYLGTPLFEGMEIPEAAELTARFSFETNGDHFTKAVVLPGSLTASASGQIDITVTSENGDEPEVAELFINDDGGILLSFYPPARASAGGVEDGVDGFYEPDGQEDGWPDVDSDGYGGESGDPDGDSFDPGGYDGDTGGYNNESDDPDESGYDYDGYGGEHGGYEDETGGYGGEPGGINEEPGDPDSAGGSVDDGFGIDSPSGGSTPGGAGELSAAPSETYWLSFEIPCIFDLNAIPPAGEDGLRTVVLRSGGQEVTINLLPEEDTIPPPVLTAIAPAFMDIMALAGEYDPLEDVLTIIDMQLFKGKMEIVEGAVVSLEDIFSLSIRFSMSADQADDMLASASAGGGSVMYEISIPEGLEWESDTGDPIDLFLAVGASKEKFAERIIIGDTVYIRFDMSFDYWKNYERLMDYPAIDDGWFNFSCELDSATVGDSESVNLQLSDDKFITIMVLENQPRALNLSKTGVFAENRFNWTILYVPEEDEIPVPDRIISDVLVNPEVHFIVIDSFKVNGVQVSAGDIEEGFVEFIYSEATEPDIPLPIGFKYHAGDDIYLIEYQTRMTDEVLEDAEAAAITAKNKAELLEEDEPITESEAQVSVGVESRRWSGKVGVQVGRDIEWTITVNTLDRDLINLVLYDRMPAGLTLLSGYPQITDGEGNTFTDWELEINGAFDPEDFDPEDDAAPGYPDFPEAYSFKIIFPEDGPYPSSGYIIKYRTSVADDYYDHPEDHKLGENGAWLDFDWRYYGGGGPGGSRPKNPPGLDMPFTHVSNIIKKIPVSYDRSTGLIRWRIEVNPYLVDVTSGTITDELSKYKQTYAGGFTIVSPVDNTDISTTGEDGDETVVFEVGGIGKNRVVFEFDAHIDDKDYAGNFDSKYNGLYENIAVFEGWLNNGTYETTDTAKASVSIVSQMLNKSGSYSIGYTNEQVPVITWYLYVNDNGMPLGEDPIIVDILPEGLHYLDGLDGSVFWDNYDFIDHYEIDKDSDPEREKITIYLIEGDSESHTIRFRTTIDTDYPGFEFEKKESITIKNTATLSHGDYDDVKSEGQQWVNNKFMTKNADRAEDDGSVIDYTIFVNPNGIELPGKVLIDKLGEGLRLDVLSIELWEARVSASGNFFEDNLLIKYYKGAANNDDYFDNIAFTELPASFEIDLPESTGRYIIKYTCYIAPGKSHDLGNIIGLYDGESNSGFFDESDLDLDDDGGGSATRMTKLTLTKLDEARPDLPIIGAKFDVYEHIMGYVEPILTMTVTTDENGEAVLFPLRAETVYEIVEEGFQPGYSNLLVLNSSGDFEEAPKVTPSVGNNTMEVEIKSGQGNIVNVTNDPVLGSFEFTKTTDRDEKDEFEPVGVDEATFTVRDITRDRHLVVGYDAYIKAGDDTIYHKTDEYGKISLSDLPFGEYEVTETVGPGLHARAAAAFVIEINEEGETIYPATAEPYIINISDGDALEIRNVYYRPSITLTKYDGTGSTALDGVEFTLTCTDECKDPGHTSIVGDHSQPGTTDATGKVTFELYGGNSYIITETVNPYDAEPGYYVTGEYEITTTATSNTAMPAALTGVTWRNYPYAATLEVKKVDSMRTGVVREGAVFRLYETETAANDAALLIGTAFDDDETHLDEQTTLANGIATFKNLALTQTGSLTIAGEPTLAEKSYWLVEAVAPDGYILDRTPIEVTLDPTGKTTPRTATYSCELENEPIEHDDISLTFTKYSNKEDSYTLGTIALEGIRFKMTDLTTNSDIVMYAESDASGAVTFSDIPFGTYRIEEVDTAGNPTAVQYHKNLSSFEVIFDKEGVCTSFNGISDPDGEDFEIVNEIFYPDLIITKTKANGITPLSGVYFELCDADGHSFSPTRTETTGASGTVTFTGLIGGDTYVVKEISSLTGYYTTGELKIGPVNQAGNYTYTWRNYEHDASIEVTKDDEMRTGVKLAGAIFELYRDDGTGEAPGSLIDTLTTDATGKVKFTGLELTQDTVATLTTNTEPVLLKTIYWLVETKAPDGYNKIDDPIKIELDPGKFSSSLDKRTGTYTFEIPNTPTNAEATTLEFTKYSDRNEHFAYLEEDNSVLAGAVFKITDQTPGSDFLQTATSDINGLVVFDDIPFGIYLVEETTTPTNHNTITQFYVTIDEDGNITEFDGKTNPIGLSGPFSITNNIKTTSLTITKQDELLAPLNNIEFQLYHITGMIETALGLAKKTDSAGKVTFIDLVAGEQYVIKEVGAPLEGYYDTGVYKFDVNSNPATSNTYTWTNYRHAAAIEVTKVDAKRTGVPVEGTVFSLYRDDGTGTEPNLPTGFIETKTTDGTGKVTFTDLNLTQNITSLTTNTEPALEETIYWLVETAAPGGYALDQTPVKVALTTRTGKVTETLENDPVTGDFEFTKLTDRDAEDVLAGATFVLTDQTTGSTWTQTATSDEEGTVSFTVIPHGQYLVTETVTPAYHNTVSPFYIKIDKTGKLVEFGAVTDPTGITDPLIVTDTIKTTTLTITKQDDAGALLENIDFELYRVVGETETKIGVSQKTNASGVVTFSGLMGGEKYVVKEAGAPLTGYYTTGEYTIDLVNPDTTYTYTWINYRHAASIEITKTDSERPGILVEGATFGLYRDNGSETGPAAGAPIATKATASDGKLTFTGIDLRQDTSSLTTNNEPTLLPTVYWLVEETAAAGYTLDSTPVMVKLTDRTGTVETQIDNDPVTGNLTFTKYTNKDSGAVLAGAVFRITDKTAGSAYIQTAASDVSGVVSFTEIPYGTYTVEETDVPAYHNAVTPFEITIDKTGELTEFGSITNPTELAGLLSVTDTIKTTSLTITKKDDAGEPLDNIEFELYRVVGAIEDKIGAAQKTNASGEVTFAGLMGGEKYTVKEAGTPLAGYYSTGEFTISLVNPDTPYTYTWINYRHAASIEITKVDTKRPDIPVKGTEFALYRDDGSKTGPASGEPVATGTTGSDGKLIFADLDLSQITTALTTGAEPVLSATIYWLVETKAADGYILNETPEKVTFDSRTELKDITIKNDPEAADITFTKFGDPVKDTPGTKVAGAIFELRDQGSSLILSATSDGSGVVSFQGVPFGIYELYETAAPNPYYYLTDDYPIDVLVDETGALVEFGLQDASGDLSLANLVSDASFTITKVESGGAPMEGIAFTLLRKSGEDWVIAGEGVTDEDGVVKFLTLYPEAEYMVIEKAPEGYYQPEPYLFSVEEDENKGVTWVNYPSDGKIIIEKKDAKRGLPLGGVRYDLYEADGTTYVMSALTDEDGIAVFDNLPLSYTLSTDTDIYDTIVLSEATYVIKEGATIAGYVKGNTTHSVILKPLEQENTLYLTNEPVTVNLAFTKLSGADGGVPLAGAEFELAELSPGTKTYSAGASGVDGQVVFNNIPFGEYELIEITCPPMHKPIEEPIAVIIDKDGNVVKFGNDEDENGLTGLETVNEAKDLSITVNKTDSSGNAMSDITFALQRKNDGVWTVSENEWVNVDTVRQTVSGAVTFSGLAPYGEYRLVEIAPAGYYQPEPYEFTVSGTGFEEAGGRTVTWVNHTSDGRIIIEKKDAKRGLPLVGVRYDLYKADGTTYVRSALTDEDGLAVFDNLPLSYTLSTDTDIYDMIVLSQAIYVIKEGAATAGYVKDNAAHSVTLETVDQENTLYLTNEPVTANLEFTKLSGVDGGVPLAGAKFRLTELSPGTKEYTAEASDSNGQVVFENIPFGEYKLIEITCPPMHKTIEEPIAVIIDKDGNVVKFGNDEDENGLSGLEIVNETEDLSITVNKTDSSGNAMSDITFALQRKNDGVWTVSENEWVNVDTLRQTTGGAVTFSGLAPYGEYRLVEIAPAGYYQPEPYEFTVSGTGFEEAGNRTVIWVNYPYEGRIEITKTDSVRGLPLEGVIYSLYQADGETLIMTSVTGEDGIAIFDNVPASYKLTSDTNLYDTLTLEDTDYIVRETATIPGYIKDISDHRISLEESRLYFAAEAWTNAPVTGNFSFSKINGWGMLLEGAEFTLTESQPGNESYSAVSNKDGDVAFTGIPFGIYTLSETVAPAGHFINPTEYTVTVGVTGVVTGDIPQGGVTNQFCSTDITITLTENITGKPLAGVSFTITEDDDLYICTAVTGEDGKLVFEGLKTGRNYTITETTPSGYYPCECYCITDLDGDTADIDWLGFPYSGTVTAELVSSKNSNTKLNGVLFELWSAGDPAAGIPSEKIGEATTDENGVLVITGLSMAVLTEAAFNSPPVLEETYYILKQISAYPRYKPAEAVEFTLTSEDYVKGIIVKDVPIPQDDPVRDPGTGGSPSGGTPTVDPQKDQPPVIQPQVEPPLEPPDSEQPADPASADLLVADEPLANEPPSADLTPADLPPGGEEHDAPPNPNMPGDTIMPLDPEDGENLYYLEYDRFGAPLGLWYWNDELSMWIFDENSPLAKMPRTGAGENPSSWLLLIGVYCICMRLLIRNRLFSGRRE